MCDCGKFLTKFLIDVILCCRHVGPLFEKNSAPMSGLDLVAEFELVFYEIVVSSASGG